MLLYENDNSVPPGYMSIMQACWVWDMHYLQVIQLLREGRIPTAVRSEHKKRKWLIPENTPRPRTRGKKLTRFQRFEIIERYENGESGTDIAHEYGLSAGYPAALVRKHRERMRRVREETQPSTQPSSELL